MRKIIIFLGLSLAGIVAWAASHIIPLSGAFAELDPVRIDHCQRLDVAPGTEDVTIDPETDLVYISAGDRRAWYNESGDSAANPSNGIYAYTLGAPETLRRISPAINGFLPHGISLWHGPDGKRRLFVVNHPPDGSEIIEIFDAAAASDGGDLVHLESISFAAMHSPNDVVAVGPREFYATNDRGYETGLMSTLELNLALPLSSTVYYNGEVGRIIVKGLTYANGINISADGKTVYIAEILKRRILLFDRDPASGALKRRGIIKVPTAPDNIEVDEDGMLWTAGHSKVFDFTAHASDASVIAPSHVVRADPETGKAETMFVSIDGEINASSAAAAYKETLIVGAVFDGHVMICPL